MQQEHTSHESPGFGRNSNGLGIAIVAIVAAILALIAYSLWHSGQEEVDFYRLSKHSQGHDQHGSETMAEAIPAGMADPAKYGALDTKGNFVYMLGDTVALRLPDSSILKVAENSTEARLLQFLIEEKMQVNNEDKTKGWITCDRIFFQTAKDLLDTTSKQQIANIATILKAFPGAAIKVGGYTDNTGDSATNHALSEARAKAVADALAAGGAKNSIAHEGYGPMWPLATNETDAGKAMNRRVDIRVTKK